MEKTLLTCTDIGLGSKETICDTRILDMTQFYSEIYTHILDRHFPISLNNGGPQPIDVTVLDMFLFTCDDHKKIIRFIKERLDLDITSTEGIKELNILFKKAKQFYQERYLKPLPTSFQKMNFKNATQAIEFLSATRTSKYHGHIYCAFAKIVYVLADVMHSEKINRSEKLDEKFLMLHLERPLQIEESHKDRYGNLYRKGKFTPINHKVIRFSLISRQKWLDSIAGKEIADPKYYSVEEFKDLVGVTFYVETQGEAILLMQFIDQMVYHGKAKISNKNALHEDCIFHQWVNDEFRRKLQEIFKPTRRSTDQQAPEESEDEKEYNERKPSTAEDYIEVKLTGNVPLPIEDSYNSTLFNFGTEIKFVIWGQDNESGIALQSIYDYIKRFRELTRLWIMITERDILNYVNHFFENIDYYLTKKNKLKSDYFYKLAEDLLCLGMIANSKTVYIGTQTWEEVTGIDEKALAKWLYEYFKSKLVKLKVKGGKKYFYADERLIGLTEVGMFREDIHVEK